MVMLFHQNSRTASSLERRGSRRLEWSKNNAKKTKRREPERKSSGGRSKRCSSGPSDHGGARRYDPGIAGERASKLRMCRMPALTYRAQKTIHLRSVGPSCCPADAHTHAIKRATSRRRSPERKGKRRSSSHEGRSGRVIEQKEGAIKGIQEGNHKEELQDILVQARSPSNIEIGRAVSG